MTKGISRRQFLRNGAGFALASVLSQSGLVGSANSARVIRHVHTNARKVCLTYDDLWSEYYTLRIGREYYRRNIRLTLFPAGRAVLNNLERPNQGYENLYPRLRDMGHEFGCHLFTHRVIRDFSRQQLTDEEMEPALYTMRRALGPGFRPVGIRPPYGHVTDALKEMSAQLRLAFDSLGAWIRKTRSAPSKVRRQALRMRRPGSVSNLLRWYGVPELLDGNLQRSAMRKTIAWKYPCRTMRVTMRPGTIILHHTIKASFEAIQPTYELPPFAWNMQPVPLSELLTLAS